ncbi:Rad9-domain-containing protein [Annulohypoxylon maeteangense]|uniref:Rad9-domain-containing protein n=1 Tax=Annulohypoxylon maeteangense TaxID=1927788 RepID=UPI0020079357|nr:Rad9-domain-containing protein [Annulohypoxylon maeteangense]KAI0887582.1 Rad9-domain-containing protein [Annulohypoxylon maeteangense]
MAVLNFTLSEEGVNALRDALSCLGKFSEEVSLEAKKDTLVFTTLNLSKSAYASFSFQARRFFSKYHFEGVPQNREKFFCKLYNRALLSLFRARSGDSGHDREKDTVIEHCDVAIVDEPGKKSRFIAKIVFRNGITTKYRLPFEVTPPVHAKFDRDQAINHWSIPSRTLRQLMDHFGPGIEYLDIHSEDDDTVSFTCFTEKVKNGEEVLKKPLHTSIAVERDEFEDFVVEEDKLHIVISVKDFRAIIQHAGFIGCPISAYYSIPSKPLQFKYEGDGIGCEFLLMTVGERGAPGQKAKKTRGGAKGAKPPQLEASTSRAASHASTPAPRIPPPKSQGPRVDPVPSLRPPITRPSQRPPPATMQSESLFVPQDDEQQWDPVNVGEDEDEEENARLEWDVSGDFNRDQPATNRRNMMADQNTQRPSTNDATEPPPYHLEPTQRLSQVRKFGFFND